MENNDALLRMELTELKVSLPILFIAAFFLSQLFFSYLSTI
jgi:hypothetical protein